MINPESQLGRLLAEALDKPPDERDAFVDTVSERDQTLHAKLKMSPLSKLVVYDGEESIHR